MFGGFGLVAVLALIEVTSPTGATTDLNYNNLCLLIPNGKMIATGRDCSDSYYLCLNGNATPQECQKGQVFSKDSQACVTASSANCGSTRLDPCNGAKTGSWVTVQGTCNSYYYCSSKGAKIGACPPGENFNPTAQACQYASTYPCNVPKYGNIGGDESLKVVGINLCSFIPNKVFFGSASDCGTWNVCKNNSMTSGTCPEGYKFNTLKAECDYPSKFQCRQVTDDPNLINVQSVGGPCTKTGALKQSSQCNAYFRCDGIKYQLLFCSVGYFYDTVSQSCVPRLQARNDCDRCIGSKQGFVNMASSKNCSGYLYCQNGIEHSFGYCQSGYFFNEQAGACLAGSQPDFGCCNPAVYSSVPASSGTSTPTETRAPSSPSATTAMKPK